LFRGIFFPLLRRVLGVPRQIKKWKIEIITLRSRTDVCGLADEQPSGRGALGVVRRSFLGLHALSVRSAAGERRIDDLVRQLEARELARLEELAHFLVWCAGVAGARLERGWGVAGAWLGRVWDVDRCRSRAKKIIIKKCSFFFFTFFPLFS
jgi:hypothetical protein